MIGNMLNKLIGEENVDVLVMIDLYCNLLKKQNEDISFQNLFKIGEMSAVQLTQWTAEAKITNIARTTIPDQGLRTKIQGTMMKLKEQLKFLWEEDCEEKTNIVESIHQGKCLCLNIPGIEHSYLEELVGMEINELIGANIEHCLAIEDISLNETSSLYQCLNICERHYHKAVACLRLSSVFGLERQGNLNDSISRHLGNFDKIIVLRHRTTQDCMAFSEAFGTYRFVNQTVGTGVSRNPLQFFRSHHVEKTNSEEDRQRLRPEDILNLDQDCAYIYDGKSSEIVETRILD